MKRRTTSPSKSTKRWWSINSKYRAISESTSAPLLGSLSCGNFCCLTTVRTAGLRSSRCLLAMTNRRILNTNPSASDVSRRISHNQSWAVEPLVVAQRNKLYVSSARTEYYGKYSDKFVKCICNKTNTTFEYNTSSRACLLFVRQALSCSYSFFIRHD